MLADATPRGVRNIFSSGSVFVDGVLSGFAWSQKSVEYAFPTNAKSYSYNGYPDDGFNSISNAQREMAMFALDKGYGSAANDGFSVEGFTNLDISKGSDKSAELRLAETSHQTPTAWGFIRPMTREAATSGSGFRRITAILSPALLPERRCSMNSDMPWD